MRRARAGPVPTRRRGARCQGRGGKRRAGGTEEGGRRESVKVAWGVVAPRVPSDIFRNRAPERDHPSAPALRWRRSSRQLSTAARGSAMPCSAATPEGGGRSRREGGGKGEGRGRPITTNRLLACLSAEGGQQRSGAPELRRAVSSAAPAPRPERSRGRKPIGSPRNTHGRCCPRPRCSCTP